ncbi:MAG: GNAT family N-acetyltransferase [Acidimicrobiales bacterium]|nr:GNAT family N-acetyltransferase [Acidimicrobiales bacterium]
MLRTVRDDDLDEILVHNNAAVPAVNHLERSDLEWFAAVAHTFVVAVADDGIAGFLIGLGPGAGYDSHNYAWFSARYDDFVYVDRIVVAEAGRGGGVGSLLYDEFARRGRADQTPVMLAEVNIRPRNDASLAFHDAHGFVSVGEQDSPDGVKRVTMLERRLDAD